MVLKCTVCGNLYAKSEVKNNRCPRLVCWGKVREIILALERVVIDKEILWQKEVFSARK